ncbi:hypothetical protein [Catalinimonas niigatensis]|uniref:hypothetical protein n=1 Tax=Catalinimonas niigatensis TaxID=1397264 RepID=UPI0026658A48|nr:hypothetical protein [Catalinimonas niigatensis]WPP49710.1 hypothetical protein PZB72_23835 [Catalinimonas niigatensis]
MHKKEQYVKKPFIRSSLVLLVVLTLFSSCSVRKPIQAELDVAVTRSFNPPKTTFSAHTQCVYADQAVAFHEVKHIDFKFLQDYLPPFLEVFLLIPDAANIHSSALASDKHIAHKVPLYILYKKMKFWV